MVHVRSKIRIGANFWFGRNGVLDIEIRLLHGSKLREIELVLVVAFWLLSCFNNLIQFYLLWPLMYDSNRIQLDWTNTHMTRRTAIETAV